MYMDPSVGARAVGPQEMAGVANGGTLGRVARTNGPSTVAQTFDRWLGDAADLHAQTQMTLEHARMELAEKAAHVQNLERQLMALESAEKAAAHVLSGAGQAAAGVPR